jgi:hypothetical protein
MDFLGHVNILPSHSPIPTLIPNAVSPSRYYESQGSRAIAPNVHAAQQQSSPDKVGRGVEV